MKIVSKILFLVIFFIFSGFNSLYSQCYTRTSTAYYVYAQNRTQIILNSLPQDSIISLPQLNKKLSLALHIVKDSLGEANVDTADIFVAIDSTNSLFKPINLFFKVCSIDSIDNFQYDELKLNTFTTTFEEEQMVNLFNVDSVINIYIVESPTGLAEKNYIIAGKASLEYIPHFMGHIFGLIHTSGNGDHTELVDGSNCLTTGDFICETEADPMKDIYNGGLVYGENGCELSSLSNPLKDTNGDWYKIPSYNYMSLYSNCWCKLTSFQYRIVVYEYYLHHTDLK
jgi:hypothetical protein